MFSLNISIALSSLNFMETFQNTNPFADLVFFMFYIRQPGRRPLNEFDIPSQSKSIIRKSTCYKKPGGMFADRSFFTQRFMACLLDYIGLAHV